MSISRRSNLTSTLLPIKTVGVQVIYGFVVMVCVNVVGMGIMAVERWQRKRRRDSGGWLMMSKLCTSGLVKFLVSSGKMARCLCITAVLSLPSPVP